MNWTMVALLSIPGLIMGLLSVRGHTRGIEPFLWLVLAVFVTLVVARTAGSRYFLHGLSVGVGWGLLNGLTAAAFANAYLRHNPEFVQRAPSGGAFTSRVIFLLGAPLIGLASGLVLGLLCWAAAHAIRPAPPTG